MIMSLKQRKIKFEPRIKLNHNIHTCYTVLKTYTVHLYSLYSVGSCSLTRSKTSLAKVQAFTSSLTYTMYKGF